MFSAFKKLFIQKTDHQIAETVTLDFNNLTEVLERYEKLKEELKVQEEKLKAAKNSVHPIEKGKMLERYYINLAAFRKLDARLRLFDARQEKLDLIFKNRPNRYLGLGDFLRMEKSRKELEQARRDLAERILEGVKSPNSLGTFIAKNPRP